MGSNPTVYVFATTTSTPSGISKGTSIGIGVGSAIGALILVALGVGFWIHVRRRRMGKVNDGNSEMFSKSELEANEITRDKPKDSHIPMNELDTSGGFIAELDGVGVPHELETPRHSPSIHPAATPVINRPRD